MEFTKQSWIILLIISIMEFTKQFWIILLIISMTGGEVVNSGGNVALVNNNLNAASYLIPCENGWFLFNDMCYKVFDKIKGSTWKKARESCSVHHGSLVTIQSKEIQDFLTTFLLLDAKSNVWIGLHDHEKESEFLWDDGSVVNYTNWEPGEPSGSKYRKEDCVEMKYITSAQKGMWNDFSCDGVSPYICQSNKSEQNLNLDPRFCTDENDGAWSYLKSCYHIVDQDMTWNDAENFCQSALRGHLLSIVDFQTNMYLTYILSKFNKEFWIGIKIREAVNNQIWTTNWPVKFKKWENENVDLIKGNCAFMTKQRVWSSAPCFQKRPFVCEVLKEKPPVLQQAPKGWSCPKLSADWIDLGGDTCYIFETHKPKKWIEANFVCSKKGGNLASIHSVAESNALHPSVISERTGAHEKLFIGLHRSLSNNNLFEWADGTELDYQNWKVGEPSSKAEKCGEVLTDDMTWNDGDCDMIKGYICSAKKVPPDEMNESAFTESQQLMNTNSSGNISSNTMLLLMFIVIAVLFVAGFTIYNYRNHCRKCNNQRWKYFGFSIASRDLAGSSQFTEDESPFRI